MRINAVGFRRERLQAARLRPCSARSSDVAPLWRALEPSGLTRRPSPVRRVGATAPRLDPGRSGCSGATRTACGLRFMGEVLTDAGGPQRISGVGQCLQMVRSEPNSARIADVAPLWRAWEPSGSAGRLWTRCQIGATGLPYVSKLDTFNLHRLERSFPMTGSQKAAYRRSVCKRLERILANDFTTPTLITLHCSSAVGISQVLAKKIFRCWKHQVQRVVGRSFKFIKIIDYGPHPIPEIVFYVIADLPKDLCREVCGAWYMGKAIAAPLDSSGFDKIADSIMRQDSSATGESSHLWSYCAKSLRSGSTLPAQ